MWKVVILGKIHEAGTARLRSAGGFVIEQRDDNPPDLLQTVRDCDAIIVRTTPITRTVVAAAERLKLVARHGVGYDAVDVGALSERRIPLAVTGDVNSTAVAEHTLALILALAKRTLSFDAGVRNGRFSIRDSFSAWELGGRELLIIGCGRIGQKVATLAKAFGMSLAIFDPFVDAKLIEAFGAKRVSTLHSALPTADVVSIHAPKSNQTLALFGDPEFALMKPSAVLVNVARGGMVDETALAQALTRGLIAGAALDVFDPEPPIVGSPLLGDEKVVLSPHSAAFTQECVQRMSMSCAENVLAMMNGAIDVSLVINPDVLRAGRRE